MHRHHVYQFGYIGFPSGYLPAKPRHGETVWNNGYKGVMYCNAAINGIENSPLEENEKLPLLGEGKIMRAFYYYLLTSFFGDVPFYTEHVADVETQQKIGRLVVCRLWKRVNI